MMYDIFFSYSHTDKDEVMPICSALRAAGLEVWMDETDVEDGASITRSIVEGLAQSKVLLAYYSQNYPRSRACQWELTAAFLASQREGGGRPEGRIRIIKPKEKEAHVEIHPVELRDALYHTVSVHASPDEISRIVESVKAHVEGVTGVFGEIRALRPAEWYGRRRGTGSNRFVGRLLHIWKIHSGLHKSEYPITSGTSASHASVVRVYGMGGVGKSLLAEEYALRYGAAFPGGVFWLSAFGNDDTKTGMSAYERGAAREGQIRQIATTLGIVVDARNPDEIEVAVRLELGKRENPFLWVVDDLPSGTDRETFESWLAPHSLGKTLITTRAREHDALGTLIPLDVLEPEEAYELLTSRRKPKVEGDRGRRRRGVDEKDEESAARGIVEALGRHALAVDVAGAALYTPSSRTPFVTFLEDLADPTDDELEFAAELAGELPTGHEASIASTFLKSIDRLESEEGLDFLRLASKLAVAPIPATLISSVFSEVDSLDERSGRRRADLAVNRAERLSLAERVEGDAGAWAVHTLISRTMRFRDPKKERSEELRDAAVEVLTDECLKVNDPITYRKLEPIVVHARKLMSGSDNLQRAELMGCFALYDYHRGARKSAENFWRREWEIRDRIRGGEDPKTLATMNNLALALKAQGDLVEARKLEEQVIGIRRRILGDEHPSTLKTITNLANTLKAQGDLAGARKIQEQVLEIRRRTLGDEHIDTRTSMHSLASTLKAQGDLVGARKLEERT